MAKALSLLILCYFIGSIPWSAIVARFFSGPSVDLTKEGTKNVGATNVWILSGPAAGCLAVLGDAAKGGFAVLMARWAGLSAFLWPMCAWMAVLGHTWSIFLRFKGGRGASATVGAFVALMPLEAMISGLMVATALLTFGGCLLLSLATLWPFCILVALARDTVDLKTACTATFLVLWVLVFGWKRLSNDLNDFAKAMEQHLVRRKLYRYSALVFPAFFYPMFGYATCRSALFASAALAVFVEFLRFRKPQVNKYVKSLFAPVGRAQEAEHLSSTTMFLAGSALATLFPDPLGVIAMIMLVLGDAWAALCGTRFGKRPLIEGKTLEGSVGCFIACFLSCLLVSKLLFLPLPILAVAIASLATTVIEIVTPKGLDNFTMAPAAALVLFLFSGGF